MNRITGGLLVLVFSMVSVFAVAGETKNETVFDCDKAPDDSVTCLACNIYHEARSEHHPGLWLVAFATKNRVDSTLYPLDNAGPKVKKEGYTSEFCKVVYEQRRDKRTKKWVPMFSWTKDGKHDRVLNAGNWYDAIELATKIVAWHNGLGKDEIVDVTFGCQWYHRYDITPYWKGDYHPTVRIGAHQCYSRNEDVYLERLNEMLPQIGMLREINAESAKNLVPSKSAP